MYSSLGFMEPILKLMCVCVLWGSGEQGLLTTTSDSQTALGCLGILNSVLTLPERVLDS